MTRHFTIIQINAIDDTLFISLSALAVYIRPSRVHGPRLNAADTRTYGNPGRHTMVDLCRG
jgi:hypothetical protein